MTDQIIDLATHQTCKFMESIAQPCFLLDVLGPGDYRFVHLNKRLTEETGLQVEEMAGRAPQEVLPARVADTVTANYEKCRADAAPHSYVELLELKNGTQWWRTSLSPIRIDDSTGEVTQILGIAIDITDKKVQDMAMTQALSEQKQTAEKIRAFATNAMLDAKSDLATVLAHLDILRDGFIDLGDSKLRTMELIEELALEAINTLNSVVEQADTIHATEDRENQIDLKHMCRDIAAVLDPDHRLIMEFPEQHVIGDWSATQIVLRCIMEYAARRAHGQVQVAVAESEDHMLEFRVSDDGVPHPGALQGGSGLPKGIDSRWNGNIGTAVGLIETRGGALRCDVAEDKGPTLIFTMPGCLATESADLKPSRFAQSLAAGALRHS